MELTHFDDQGNAWMVDVGGKDNTERVAIAEGFIAVNKDIYNHIANKSIKKGDVLTVAQLAAIMGAKQTSQLIPLCHPLSLTKVEVHCELVHGTSPACYNETQTEAIRVTATVKTIGKTGVEMEALTAVQVGLLTIYDMCKAIDKGMVMGPTQLIEKRGGNSGDFHRK